MFCWSILSKYLQFTVNILDMLLVFPPQKKNNFFWENVPEAKKQRLLFAVYCEYLVPWPKYGHQKYNIWHLLTISFPKIYTVWGHNGQFHYLWLFRAVQFTSSNRQIWVKITWPKLECAQTKLAINYYWDQKFSLSLGELWPKKHFPQTGCFEPSILFL